MARYNSRSVIKNWGTRKVTPPRGRVEKFDRIDPGKSQNPALLPGWERKLEFRGAIVGVKGPTPDNGSWACPRRIMCPWTWNRDLASNVWWKWFLKVWSVKCQIFGIWHSWWECSYDLASIFYFKKIVTYEIMCSSNFWKPTFKKIHYYHCRGKRPNTR